MKTPILALAATMLASPAFAMMPLPHGIQQGNRATMALNALESKGYVDFSHFRVDGRNFAADVSKNGKMIHVLVAPETGTVSVLS